MDKKIYIVYFNGTSSYLTWAQIGIVVSKLKENFNYVSVMNITDDSISEAVNEINKANVALLIMFIKFKTYECSRKFLSMVSAEHICACHSLPTQFPDAILQENEKIDSIILGEEEDAVVDLTYRLLNGISLEGCKGIIYRKSKENLYKNFYCDAIKDLDKLPYPDRDSFPNNKRFFHIIASRGCIGNCSFCTREELYKQSHKQRFRSIPNIVKEIDSLVKKYNCKYVGISDSSFCGRDKDGLGYQRLKELYLYLDLRSYRIEFFLNMRSEQINQKSIYWIKQLNQKGLSMLFLGIESFNPEDLKIYKKIASVEENITAIKAVKNLKIDNSYLLRLEYGFINFNPYSTIKGIQNNIEMLWTLQLPLTPDIIMSRVDIRYGTTLYDKAVKDGCCSDTINLYNKSVNYNFKNKDVAMLSQLLEKAFSSNIVKKYENFEILYNRYLYFKGKNMLTEELLDLYSTLIGIQTQFSYFVFKNVMGGLNAEIKFNLNDKIDDLKENLIQIQNKFEIKFKRIVVELQKINELSYF